MSMNHFLKSLLLALLVTASASAVELRWSGAVSTDYMDPANWFQGTTTTPATVAPVAGDFINIQWPVGYTPAYLPHISTAVPSVNPISVGSATNPGTLYIDPGASITTGSNNNQWGYKGDIFMSGGTAVTGGNMQIKWGNNAGTGAVTMTGGSLTVNSGKTLTFVEQNSAAYGYLNVYGGTFNCLGSTRVNRTGTVTASQWGVTVRDSGTAILGGNGGLRWDPASTVGRITAATQNLKTGDPKQGLVLSWETRYTPTNPPGNYSWVTISAKYGVSTPLAPTAGQAVAPGSTILQWKNSAPYFDGTTMTRYVRLKVLGPEDVNETTGVYADPNGDSYPIIAGPLTADEPNIVFTAVYGENYRWRVDSVDPGDGSDPNYPKTIPSPAQVIVCRNQAPVVTIPTTATTPIGLRGGTAAWTTIATAKDDGLPIGGPALTFAWTQVGGPAVTINNATTLSPSVTFTAANTYTFRLSVSDSDPDQIGTADVAVTVYANVCEATKARAGYTASVGDLNADCWVSFADLALMASNWSVCNSLDPADPACTGL